MTADMSPAEYRQQVARTMSEAAFQRRVIELAHFYGWRVAHFRGVPVRRKDGSTRYQTPVQADGAGFPDLVMVRGQRVIYAELKTQKGQLRPEQAEWIAAFRDATEDAYLWRPSDMPRIEEKLR